MTTVILLLYFMLYDAQYVVKQGPTKLVMKCSGCSETLNCFLSF